MADITIDQLVEVARLLRSGAVGTEDDLVTPKKVSYSTQIDALDAFERGHNETILVVLNGNNPPTVQQYTRFCMYGTAGIVNKISEPSADQVFAWSAGNFPAQANGTWYLYCQGNGTSSTYAVDTGDYGASQNPISWSSQKGGWYNNDGKVIAAFDSAAGVVSNLTILENNLIKANEPPAFNPGHVGQKWIDLTACRYYTAVGTSALTDWCKAAIQKYDTVTVVAAAGDVTVNLDFDWTDGLLIICRSLVAASYFDDGTTTVLVEVTHDALTDTHFAYTDKHEMAHIEGAAGHLSAIKSTVLIGLPNAATATSFTLKDAGGADCYVKWMIIA